MTIVPFDLSFSQTLWANAVGALFTAAFVTLGAGVLVKRFEIGEDRRRTKAENDRNDAIRQADEARADALLKADRERADALLKADQERADALALMERDRADLQKQLDEEHDERQQSREHEFQARSALRDSYARLLVAQRRSRQASIALSRSEGEPRESASSAATEAHDGFIDEYHRLSLDADPSMWRELRGLRAILDDMLKYAESGRSFDCEELADSARAARQNLERSFRLRLGHLPLQERRPLGEYDKVVGG